MKNCQQFWEGLTNFHACAILLFVKDKQHLGGLVPKDPCGRGSVWGEAEFFMRKGEKDSQMGSAGASGDSGDGDVGAAAAAAETRVGAAYRLSPFLFRPLRGHLPPGGRYWRMEVVRLE